MVCKLGCSPRVPVVHFFSQFVEWANARCKVCIVCEHVATAELKRALKSLCLDVCLPLSSICGCLSSFKKVA